MIVQRIPPGYTSVLPAFVALLILFFSAPAASLGGQESMAGSDARAVEFVDRWIDAIGGLEHLHGFVSARFTFTTEMYDAQSGRLRRTRPRYVTIERRDAGLAARIERWEGDDFIVQGWDGVVDWAFTNGRRLDAEEKDQREVRYVSGDVNYWTRLPQKLKDPGVFLHYDGLDAAGRHAVRVTFGEGVGDSQDTYFYYFVDDRVWPVQVDFQSEGSTRVEHTRWEDIRSAGDYYYVGARVHFDDEGRIFKIIRMTDVDVNPRLAPEVFTELDGAGG